MSEKKHYVQPPKNDNFKQTVSSVKHNYDYLMPAYRKRMYFQIAIMAVLDWIMYGFILGAFFLEPLSTPGPMQTVLTMVFMALHIFLTVVGAYFYPFSRYWYLQSFIGRLLNNMYYFGGFWSVIGKVIATMVGGVLIAGLLAPIAGPLVLRKCKRENVVIGQQGD
ncbi:hypothetical protein [Lactiplantibacillus plajomi]|uniref:RDD family protein n=1 Tax=Lactiplantibacillus plajomi TaxID=1457217 RepID=A0ABV6K1E9_9LACO|nr:hypothetical protein [Lactiplantibacillus plajomi]